MSLEILEAIRQAEQKAEAIRADAQAEARDMIKGVELACVEHERAAAHDNRALFQAILDERRQAVSIALKEKRGQEAKQQEEVFAQARTRLDAAASRIFERVVSDGHR